MSTNVVYYVNCIIYSYSLGCNFIREINEKSSTINTLYLDEIIYYNNIIICMHNAIAASVRLLRQTPHY